MPKHERLSHRHRSHHLVFASPRVFVRNGQQFANPTYDVVLTHGSLITAFTSRQSATHRLTNPFFRDMSPFRAEGPKGPLRPR